VSNTGWQIGDEWLDDEAGSWFAREADFADYADNDIAESAEIDSEGYLWVNQVIDPNNPKQYGPPFRLVPKPPKIRKPPVIPFPPKLRRPKSVTPISTGA